MKVAILGGGLSAAFAYRACVDHGLQPDIYADRLFTPRGGNIWIHWLPDSVRGLVQWEPIRIYGVGNAATYAEKMWGDPFLQTSFPHTDQRVYGANPALAAQALWGDRKDGLLVLGKLSEDDIAILKNKYDVVIQTFPAEHLRAGRVLWDTPIWVLPNSVQKDNWVCYYGKPTGIEHVRESQLFGFRSCELPPIPKGLAPSRAERWAEKNRVSTQRGAKLWLAPEIPPHTEHIECWDKNVLFTGRYALWDRKFLSHDTYQHIVEQLGLNKEVGRESQQVEAAYRP